MGGTVSISSDVEHLREKPLSRQTIFSGGIITLHQDKVAVPGGGEANRELVEHPGAIGVVGLDVDGRAVLVRQWRHPIGRAVWEVCAGTLNRGEDPAAGAKREFAEETGYTAKSWKSLGGFALAPGYSTEVMHLYLATGLVGGTPHPDEHEILDVEFFAPRDVSRLIAGGEVDMKTVGALALTGFDINA